MSPLVMQIGGLRLFYLSLIPYVALLQFYYPFTDLPISDCFKEFLQATTVIFTESAGLTGMAYILIIFSYLTIIRSIILIAMRFRPAFKAKVEEYREARRARLQQLTGQKKSKHFIVFELIWFSICVAMVINAAIFKSPDDASVVDGMTRIVSGASFKAVVVAIVIPVVFSIVYISGFISGYRESRARTRLARDEELRVGTEQMRRATTLNHGLEEKLIEF
jgi:hypothetical protein